MTSNPEGWVATHYETIDGDRLRCRTVPYSDQLVYAGRDYIQVN